MKKNHVNKKLQNDIFNTIKNRKSSLENKTKIFNVLKEINHKADSKFHINLSSIRYGDGYFIFQFDKNSVAWFFIEELPDWKFGIWLNKDKDCVDYDYEIFGEAILLIDKFKPSASVLSENNNTIDKFISSIYSIINREEEWQEYLNDLDRMKIINENSIKFNNTNFKNINDYIIQHNRNKSDIIKLKLIDRNTKDFKVSPRYSIEIYFNTNVSKDIIKNEEKRIFLELCELIKSEIEEEYTDELGNRFYVNADDFIFFNKKIQSKKDYKHDSLIYNWKRTFEEYLNDI